MPNYPFQRAKALGYALFENFPSAHANIIDANAAQAADGLVWTDVAAFRNFSAAQVLANTAYAAVYNTNTKTWVVMTVAATLPRAFVRFGGTGLFVDGGATTSSAALTPRKRAADFNPAGNVALFGGVPGASSNKKYVRCISAVTQGSMASPLSTQTNTSGVNCIKWVPSLGLWIAGHDGTGAGLAAGLVETSPDAITFTSRTTPNQEGRASIAVGPAGVVISSETFSTKVIHSTNGINWFERTMPGAAQQWINVVYVPLLGKYVAISADFTAVAYSTDAINWSAQPFTTPANWSNLSVNGQAVAFGRTIFVIGGYGASTANVGVYSQDGGASWSWGATFPYSATNSYLAGSDNQLLYGDGTSVYLSIASGF